jgi:hypothetical protein
MLWIAPPLASFFGFRSRALVFLLVSFLGAILFFLAIYFGLFVVVLVSDTEEHLMPALNVLFWNQVVEANQFISCALAPLIS